MASLSKRKGDRAEIEVQGILRDLLGVPARRLLGAGRKDDVGDIGCIPSTVIQVANWKDVTAAVRQKPIEADQQLEHARAMDPGVTFAATFVRLRGGDYRVVLTPEQWATYWREAIRTDPDVAA